MQLVKSEYNINFQEISKFSNTSEEEVRKVLAHDYFIEALQDFPRIQRQKGIFLFMGNLTNTQMLSREIIGKCCDHKVKHELSPTVGRGEEYEGYVGVLRISQNSISQIRDELEQSANYNINYLMAKDIE